MHFANQNLLKCMCHIVSFFTKTEFLLFLYRYEKVQVGNDQEKAQSEKDSHSKIRGGKKLK